jgi:hypothetical protein
LQTAQLYFKFDSFSASPILGFLEESVSTYMKELFSDIKHAAGRNLKPGIVLQIFAAVLVLSYYFIPQVTPAFEYVMRVKIKYGIFYSIIATCFFGGIVPLIVLRIMGRLEYPNVKLRVIAMIVFWMWKGIEIELFYGFQVFLFGSDPSTSVVIKKVLFDQFVFNPVYAAPFMLSCYMFIDCSCSFRAFRKKIDKEFFIRKLLTALASTWCVWIPATAIVYSLPITLQIPVCNLVLCFWSLMFDIVSKSGVKK